ncbi:MAG: diaminopimelate epimerase [Candidatus Sumerlaeia bacterium]|nr:diaminopimelate epimerase [Candidatus Sumerlaeia bacterium]
MEFWKFSGAGNDFVTFDNRVGALPGGPAREAWIRRLCARGEGVGADGALILESTGDADVRMRYHNADGGEAGMCGNGLRCLARFAHLIGAAGPAMTVRTMAGRHRAEIVDDTKVRVSITDPGSIRRGLALDHGGRTYYATAFDLGVPQVVIDLEPLCLELDAIDVGTIGRALRHHPEVLPAGANINFFRCDGESVRMRTYERGVEAETLACGTGATATALTMALDRGQGSPVEITTRSGHSLTIGFRREGDTFRDLTLEGPATLTFRGTLASALLP